MNCLSKRTIGFRCAPKRLIYFFKEPHKAPEKRVTGPPSRSKEDLTKGVEERKLLMQKIQSLGKRAEALRQEAKDLVNVASKYKRNPEGKANALAELKQLLSLPQSATIQEAYGARRKKLNELHNQQIDLFNQKQALRKQLQLPGDYKEVGHLLFNESQPKSEERAHQKGFQQEFFQEMPIVLPPETEGHSFEGHEEDHDDDHHYEDEHDHDHKEHSEEHHDEDEPEHDDEEGHEHDHKHENHNESGHGHEHKNHDDEERGRKSKRKGRKRGNRFKNRHRGHRGYGGGDHHGHEHESGHRELEDHGVEYEYHQDLDLTSPEAKKARFTMEKWFQKNERKIWRKGISSFIDDFKRVLKKQNVQLKFLIGLQTEVSGFFAGGLLGRDPIHVDAVSYRDEVGLKVSGGRNKHPLFYSLQSPLIHEFS